MVWFQSENEQENPRRLSSKSLNIGEKKKRKKNLVPQLKGRREEGFFSHAGGRLLFYPSLQLIGRGHMAGGNLLHSAYQLKCQSHQQTPSLTSSSSSRLFDQVSGHPMTQLNQHM